MLTNHDFARAVGCDHTMASRLRNGKRRPSTDMLVKICAAYDLDKGTALDKLSQGPKRFSEWLVDQVFDPPEQTEAA